MGVEITNGNCYSSNDDTEIVVGLLYGSVVVRNIGIDGILCMAGFLHG